VNTFADKHVFLLKLHCEAFNFLDLRAPLHTENINALHGFLELCIEVVFYFSDAEEKWLSVIDEGLHTILRERECVRL